MFCARCHSGLPECTCDDREDRLRALAASEHFVTDRCIECAEHPASCECDEYAPAGEA